MRGTEERSGELFSYVDLEDRVPTGHPLVATGGAYEARWRVRGFRGCTGESAWAGVGEGRGAFSA
jgi:hypothetical protein